MKNTTSLNIRINFIILIRQHLIVQTHDFSFKNVKYKWHGCPPASPSLWAAMLT